MISHRRHPGFDHLDGGQFHAPIDIFGAEVGFIAPDVIVKPRVHIDIFSDAPKEHHGAVSVAVYKPRHSDLSASVEDVCCS